MQANLFDNDDAALHTRYTKCNKPDNVDALTVLRKFHMCDYLTIVYREGYTVDISDGRDAKGKPVSELWYRRSLV